MPSAKSLFLERISSLEQSVNIEAVTNKSLTDKEHNNIARMLRNGLAVVGFAALEDFIKSRTSEVLSEVGQTSVPFQNLPEKLRYATTYEAISALSYQLSIRPKSDRVTYIQEQALKLASTASTAYELMPHAFGYDQANLQEDTVKSILKSFLVDDPWGEMTQLASRLGLVALPLAETFKSAALRRHRAAHVAHADTPQTDIIQFIKEAFAIAVGFDALLTKALSRLRMHDVNYLNGRNSIKASSISIRTVKQVQGQWKEYVEGRSTAVKVENDLSVLILQSKRRAISSENLLVQLASNGEIELWECN